MRFPIKELITTAFAAGAVALMGAGPAHAAIPPAAADDNYATTAGITFTVAAPGVMSNDTNIPAGAGVSADTSSVPGLLLNGNGSITYTVPKNASGTKSFQYCIVDLPGSPSAQCISGMATVKIVITPPAAANDTFNASAGTTLTVAAPGVLGNDTNVPPGAGVSANASTVPGLTYGADGSLNWVVPKNASGVKSFQYCIVDFPGSPSAQCISNYATVTINVAAPVLADDSYDVLPGSTFTVAAPGVLANDTIGFPNPHVQWQTSPPSGFTLNHDGSIAYVVPESAIGTMSFTYCILDLPGSPSAQCISNRATVTVRVFAAGTPTPTPPPAGGGTGPNLPTTGMPIGMLTGIGVVFVATGAAAVLLARRRTRGSNA